MNKKRLSSNKNASQADLDPTHDQSCEISESYVPQKGKFDPKRWRTERGTSCQFS
ncbi:MAG: hypothetical protein ACJZ77_00960 [Pseudohongiellaceae bacterium]